jgi:hypothetical protein
MNTISWTHDWASNKNDWLASDTVQHATTIQESTRALADLNSRPCASTAMEYAESCWYYLDDSIDGGNSINTYPLMFFINADNGTYMVYSSITKSWFTIWYDGTDKVKHELDTFWWFGSWWAFKFISNGSSFIFDATFKNPLIVDVPKVASLGISTNGTYTEQRGISKFH